MIYTSLRGKFNSTTLIVDGCKVMVKAIEGRGLRVSFKSEATEMKSKSPVKRDDFDIYVLIDRLEVPRKSCSNDVHALANMLRM
jgi:hypothetical protein